MKNEEIKIGIKEIQKIKMTTEEKEYILGNILTSSASTIRPIKSPYSFISFFQKNHFAYYTMALCLVLLLGSSGVVLSSQKSLPGNTLYPIKVSILEPINSALKLSPETKARYESSLVKERFTEVEILASQGKLDDEKEKQINNLLSNHTVAFEKAMEELEKSESNEEAPKIAINFQNQIEKHTQNLDTITRQVNKEKQEQEDLKENKENSQIARIDQKKNKEKIKKDDSENKEKTIVKKKENEKDDTKTSHFTSNPVVVEPNRNFVGAVATPQVNINSDSRKFIEIASPLFTKWLEQLIREKGGVLDYKINTINFVASKENIEESRKDWFGEEDSKDAFIVTVRYSIRTIFAGNTNYWMAGNGTLGEDGWILNKTLFITIDKGIDGYYVKNAGTGP